VAPVEAPTGHEGSNAEEAKSKKEFERKQREDAEKQNLPEGGVPERRPIASQTAPDNESDTVKKLREAGDPRGGQVPAMDKAAYDRAGSKEQAKKAAKEERSADRLYPGARGYIDNEGEPDHGRAVAVNRVSSFKEGTNENAQGIDTRFQEVEDYECVSRDGRSELLIVSAEHLKVGDPADPQWGKTPV
jgi:hypothetical protein